MYFSTNDVRMYALKEGNLLLELSSLCVSVYRGRNVSDHRDREWRKNMTARNWFAEEVEGNYRGECVSKR